MDNGTEPLSPVEYPKIDLGGKTYSIRLSLGAMFRLEEQGIDAPTMFRELSSWVAADGKAAHFKISFLVKILAAAIGDQTKMGPEQIADMLEFADLGQIASKIGAALLKMRFPAAVPLREPGQQAAAEPPLN